VRPVIASVTLASGLRHVGVATTALAWTRCAVLLAAGAAWGVYAKPLRRHPAASRHPTTENEESLVADEL